MTYKNRGSQRNFFNSAPNSLLYKFFIKYSSIFINQIKIYLLTPQIFEYLFMELNFLN